MADYSPPSPDKLAISTLGWARHRLASFVEHHLGDVGAFGIIRAAEPALGRFPGPEKVAKAALFLAVDANYITGQRNVNGGAYR